MMWTLAPIGALGLLPVAIAWVVGLIWLLPRASVAVRSLAGVAFVAWLLDAGWGLVVIVANAVTGGSEAIQLIAFLNDVASPLLRALTAGCLIAAALVPRRPLPAERMHSTFRTEVP